MPAIPIAVQDASAIALGFIHNNLKGAADAYKFSKEYTKMAKTRKERSRKHKRTKDKNTKKHSSKKVKTVHTIAGAKSKLAASTVGTSLRLPRVVSREAQPVVKIRKTVKVSSSFRAKTKEVIAEKCVSGIYITDQVEFMRVGQTANQQDWAAFPNNGHVNDAAKGQLFGLTRIVAAASRCWNKRFSPEHHSLETTKCMEPVQTSLRYHNSNSTYALSGGILL